MQPALSPTTEPQPPKLQYLTKGKLWETAKKYRRKAVPRYLPLDHPITKAQRNAVIFVVYIFEDKGLALCLDIHSVYTTGGTAYLIPVGDISKS